MQRNSNERKIFIGTEVENTPAKGLRTLFVAGKYEPYHIIEAAQTKRVEHIYLGANQSLRTQNEVIAGAQIAYAVLQGTKYKVTLDVPVELIYWLGYNLLTNENFIPMVSVRAQYIETLALNPNTTIKIDDDVERIRNTGVWCHPLTSLLTDEAKTEWSAYSNDKDM